MDPVEPSTSEVYDGDVCPATDTDDSYNITDKIGIGYQVNEKLMVGATKDGDENYELIGRYTIKEGMWATCIYNYFHWERFVNFLEEIELSYKKLKVDHNQILILSK